MVFLKSEVYPAPNPVAAVIAAHLTGTDVGKVVTGLNSQVAGEGISERQVDRERVLGKRRVHRGGDSRSRTGRNALIVVIVDKIGRERSCDPGRQIMSTLDTGAER